jgi:hypothetical protein
MLTADMVGSVPRPQQALPFIKRKKREKEKTCPPLLWSFVLQLTKDRAALGVQSVHSSPNLFYLGPVQLSPFGLAHIVACEIQ